MTRCMITLPLKITLKITDFSLHIPSHWTQSVQHVHLWFQLVPALTYPYVIFWKGLNKIYGDILMTTQHNLLKFSDVGPFNPNGL